MRKLERGQMTVFFVLILTGLLLLTAVGIEIGRIVYARGEVGKAADAAALAAASRVDVSYYKETGDIRFLPDVYATAQNFASMNSVFLQSRHIGVVVTGISVSPSMRVVLVRVSANLASMVPSVLPFQGIFTIAGTAQIRIEER